MPKYLCKSSLWRPPLIVKVMPIYECLMCVGNKQLYLDMVIEVDIAEAGMG